MTVLDGRSLGVEDLARVAAGGPCSLDPGARTRMDASARYLAGRPDAAVVRSKWAWIGGGETPGNDQRTIRTFIEGHCAGVGEPLPREIVRATICARANVLAQGLSGCRAAVVDTLLAMLEADVVPVVPSIGPTGAAGSSALAHVALVASRMGGEAWRGGSRLEAARAMEGLPAIELTEKEALSLLNGATLSAAMAGLAVARAARALETAIAACALSFEVVRANHDCLSPLAMEARGHRGPVRVAARLAALVEGSDLVTARRHPDSFSIRCAPVVLGAVWDALEHTRHIVRCELNAAVDNPLVFPDHDTLVEAGNFHGAPVALAMDHLKVALTQAAGIAERRIFRLTYAQLSGLPSFLLKNSGVNSGLMLAQYTAASLVNECKGLAHPASVDSIPTVQHREDHVSMGPVSAATALQLVELLEDVVAIELLCAAQGLDFRLDQGCTPGAGTRTLHARVRAHVTRWTDDRVMHPDLQALGDAVRAGAFLGALTR